MENKTHVTWTSRARTLLSAVVSAILTIPAALGASPAAATGGTPGPIPSVTYVSHGPGSVSIDWTAPWTDGGSTITDYRVDVRESGSLWRTFADGVSTELSATITGLAANTDYQVRVAAVNANGDGPATVLGAMDTLIANRNDVCGRTSHNSWTCFGGGSNRIKSVVYGVYPGPATERATDIVDFDGQCAVSASVGVICNSDVNNRYGELGQGFIGGASGQFIVPGLPQDIVAVNSTRSRACAIDTSAQLWCWGRWASLYASTAMLSPTVVKRNVAQFEGDCVRFRDDTVECVNSDGTWLSIPGLPTLSKIADDSNYTSTCGITADRSVLCFDTARRSFLEKAGWEDVVDLVDGSALCALIADGTVKCYGNNSYGELGNGTFTAGSSTVRLPEPAISIASHHQWDSGSHHFVCAVGVSGATYCWGDWLNRFPSGQTTSSIPYAVTAPGAQSVQSMPTPGELVGLEQTGRYTHCATVRWTALPNTGDVPVDGYRVRWSTTGGLSWSSTTTTSNSWTSPYLPSNTAVLVAVSAYNAAGIGAENAMWAATTYPPARPTSVRQISRTANSAVIGWTRSPDEDEPITGYRVQWASDGETWHDVTTGPLDSTATIEGLPTGSAIEVRVRAENAAGISSWTTPLLVATSGTNAQDLSVTDSYGSPVIGGQVTWVTPTGSFQSAVDYGLTDRGTVTFPVAPAGTVTVTLNDVLLPGGTHADYQTSVLFGSGRHPRIELPAEPSRAVHVVRVTLPNGLPVMGASVTVDSLDGSANVNGARFTTPDVVTSGITNEFGEVELVGYSNETTSVSIEYNDGVLIQRIGGLLGLTDADFQFDEMPWIDTTVETVTGEVGDLVSIPVTAQSSSAVVKITAPAQSDQQCSGRVLSARVDSRGHATLKVCATASGRFALSGTGAVPTGVVQLHISGTTSLAVRNLSVASHSHGALTASWTKPSWTGGKKILKYKVVVTKPNGDTITKYTTSRSITVSDLRGAKVYKVSVIPVTKLGNGTKTSRRVPVS